MTCGSVMTPNPSCCLPGDSVSTAARIMKQQDVGPVPVVNDHTQMELLGIVTDRDIAIQVVAEGRDAYSTRVDSIMSSNPVTVQETDDIRKALKEMSQFQVRRVPVVDSNNRVVGIISQADIARAADEEQVGEMVEEISQPYGMGEWIGGASGRKVQRVSPGGGVSALAMGALCLGFGAGLMFLLDPAKGRRRRERLVSRGEELWQHRSELVDQAKSAIGMGAASRESAREETAEELPHFSGGFGPAAER